MSWYWLILLIVVFLVLLGLVSAIAIQLRQELESRNSEHLRLRTLWNQFPGIVTEIRPDGTIIGIGESAAPYLNGRVPEGNNVCDYLAGEAKTAFTGALARALETREPQMYEVIAPDGNGNPCSFTNRLLPVLADQRVTSLLILSLDRTEMHKVEAELTLQKTAAEGASAAKSRFLASMSHEIRNPLNSVAGMVTLLGATSLEPRQRQYLNTLQQAADHLLGIVNDVLDLSRIEAGKLELSEEEFDLPDLAQHVTSMMHHQASEKRLAMQLFIADDTPVQVWGDALRVRQILMNLLSNAVKFTEQGHVILKVSCSETGIRFAVEDTGMGIESERARSLFEEYGTVHGKISLDQGGTGLGLNICKRLTEAMGGYIGVLSTPEVGSCFWVDLPLRRAGGLLFSESMPQEYHQNTLWVADSFAVNRTLVAAVARRLGMSVRGFDRLRDLLNALENDKPDILVMSRRFFLAPDTQAHTGLISGTAMKVAVSCDETFSEDWRAPADLVHESWSWPLDQRELSLILTRLLEGPSGEQTDLPPTDTPQLTLNVLVTEDDPVNLKIAEHFLRNIGCEVMTAVSGEEALARLAENNLPDLIIMDRHMPGIDGLETTRRIRADSRYDGIPVIALSADVMPEQQAEFIAAGAAGALSKPLRPEELRDLIARHVEVTEARSRKV